MFKSLLYVALVSIALEAIGLLAGFEGVSRAALLLLAAFGLSAVAGAVFGLAIHAGYRTIGKTCGVLRCVVFSNYALNTTVLIMTGFMALGLAVASLADMGLVRRLLLAPLREPAIPTITRSDSDAILLCLGISLLGILAAVAWFLVSWRAFAAANGVSGWKAGVALAVSLALVTSAAVAALTVAPV